MGMGKKLRWGLLLFGAGVLVIPAVRADDEYHPRSISREINSSSDELAPVFSMDGKTLYFCREGHPENTGVKNLPDDQDIWVSHLRKNGWSTPAHLAGGFNSQTYDFPIGASSDGSVLYIGNMYSPDGKIFPGVSKTRRKNDAWQWPQPMKIQNYYNYSNLVNYHISSDEKVLILNMERSDTYGKMDIYVSFLEKNGEWTEPMNIGSNVNSLHQEVTPFLAKDMRSLYFASNRPGGWGGYDTYVSRRLDDTWQNWSIPENLGNKINTKRNDINYVIAPGGQYAVFSSDVAGSKDLYQIKIPEKFRPMDVPVITGVLVDSEGKEVSGVLYFSGKGLSRSAVKTDERGHFTWIAPSAGEFTAKAAKDGYFPMSRKFSLAAGEKRHEKFTLTALAQKATLVLQNIFFDYNSHIIKPESFEELNNLAEVLQTNPQMAIEISGHTDSTGNREYNMELSRRRAVAVKNYLVEKKIQSQRIQTNGYGDTKPIAANDTEKGRSLNRRVEFTVMKNS